MTKTLVIMLLVFIGVPAAVIAVFGASRLDAWTPDGESIHAAAWLRTQDAAPGDTVGVRVVSASGFKTAITSVKARFGSSAVAVEGSGPNWGSSISTRADVEDEQTFALDIPSDTPIGPSFIELQIDMVVASAAGDRTFVNVDAHDTIKLPITIRTAGDRTTHRWIHRAIAFGAWLVAFAIAYWLIRLQPRIGGGSVGEGALGVIGLAFIAVLFALGVAGQVLFVRPALATTTNQSWLLTTGLMIAWVAALVLGGWRGARPRSERLRWSALKLRAVAGSGNPTLPAVLSRKAPRKSADELARSIQSAGCTVERTRNGFDVRLESLSAMRLRSKRAQPWEPEDLQIQIYDELVPRPIIAQLVELYGPLEYRAMMTNESAIVETQPK